MPQEDSSFYESSTMTYNVTELIIEPVPVRSEAAALGAAILAAAGMGLYPDVQTAARAMTGRDPRGFVPVPERRAFYERLYRNVYRFLFPSLQKYLDALDDLSSSAGDSLTRP
jgi:ribulose kinase